MRRRVILLVVVALISLAATTCLFWLVERGSNPQITSIFDAMWWWIVTSGTVGYGDVVPVTAAGRAVAIVTILVGFFIFANFIAIIAESVHMFLERRERGTVQVKCRDHIVICEYTAVADELIHSLPTHQKLSSHEVVIVSNLVPRNPYPQHSFVIGVPINPDVLKRANIQHAQYVFIFANMRFGDPDVKTLHIATRVKALNPGATVFVEMVNPNNDLLNYAPKDLVPLDSKDILKTVLRDQQWDPLALIK